MIHAPNEQSLFASPLYPRKMTRNGTSGGSDSPVINLDFSRLFHRTFSIRQDESVSSIFARKNEPSGECAWTEWPELDFAGISRGRERGGLSRGFLVFGSSSGEVSCGLAGGDSERAGWDFDEWPRLLFALIYRAEACRQLRKVLFPKDREAGDRGEDLCASKGAGYQGNDRDRVEEALMPQIARDVVDQNQKEKCQGQVSAECARFRWKDRSWSRKSSSECWSTAAD